MITKTYSVSGMAFTSCQNTVQKKLEIVLGFMLLNPKAI